MTTPSEYPIRWAVTHIHPDGERRLTFACQGRYTYATKAEADASIAATIANNNPRRLAMIYGDDAPQTFKASRFRCYPGHHDPVGIYPIEEAEQ